MNRLEEILNSNEKILVDKTAFMLLLGDCIDSWRENRVPLSEIMNRVITVLVSSNLNVSFIDDLFEFRELATSEEVEELALRIRGGVKDEDDTEMPS